MKSTKQQLPWDTDELLSLSSWDFEINVNGAKHGITEDARMFLHSCALFLEEGDPLPYPYAEYLAILLKRISVLESPWGASLLNRTKGQKGADQYKQRFEIAREVWELIQKKKKSVQGAAEYVSQQRRKLAQEERVTKIAQVTALRAAKLYYTYEPILNRKVTSTSAAKAAPLPRVLSPLTEQFYLDSLDSNSEK